MGVRSASAFAGEVSGAHKGVAFLGQQKSVVHNWWTERSGTSRLTERQLFIF